MADVFISYPRTQRALVDPIKNALEGLGLSVFYDVQGIDGGAGFPDVIDRELRACKAVLSCWSPAYFERRWCMIEARVGLDRDILVPVAIERFSKDAPPADLRFVNYFSLADWRGQAQHEDWTRTLRTLSRHVGRDLTGGTRAPPPPRAAPERPVGKPWRDAIPGLPATAAPEMVTLPRGRFRMGGPKHEAKAYGEDGREEPQHDVSIDYWLALGRYAVTVGEFTAFVEQTGYPTPPKATLWSAEQQRWMEKDGVTWRTPGFKQAANHPVVCVSQEDANAYIAWLNRATGRHNAYRLPSEAEWEYGCRAGTQTAYAFGDKLRDSHANFNNTIGATRPCGSYPANAFGLHDMHGNACEWCEDVWHETYVGAPTNGSAWTSGGDQTRRVHRGGAWALTPELCRSAARVRDIPDGRTNCLGFRLARTLA